MGIGPYAMAAPNEALVAQSNALLDEIGRAREALAGVETIDVGLHDRIRPLFEQTLGDEEARLGAIRAEIANRSANDASWDTLQQSRATVRQLFREILLFVQGASSRGDGLDRGVCRLADAMLDDLSHRGVVPWDRLTILAEREYFGELAQVIRLRFPDATLWALPAAAHEFAHFLVIGLHARGVRGRGDTQPLLAHLEAITDGGARDRLEELFGDVFATFALGPSYALMCSRLRFDAADANRLPSHPRSGQRLEAILATLEWMAAEDRAGSPYSGLVGRLRDDWTGRSTTRGATAAAGPELDLAAALPPLHALLSTHLRQVRYATYARAQALRPALRTADVNAIDRRGLTIPDVLNAAWLARVDAGEMDTVSIDAIEAAGLRLAGAVADDAARRAIGGAAIAAGADH